MRRTRVITVLKSGGDFKPDHVVCLHNSVLRHAEFPVEFVCLTDFPAPFLPSSIVTIPLEHNLPGWWSKAEIYRHDLIDPRADCWYMDLDTVVVGPFDRLCDDSSYIALRGFYKSSRFGSGLMRWPGRMNLSHIPDRAVEHVERLGITRSNWKRHGDQDWIGSQLEKEYVPVEYFQDVWPGEVISYKIHCMKNGGPSKKAKVVCFHGKPRPWDVQAPWVLRELTA